MRSLRMRLIVGAVVWIAIGVAAAGVLLSAVFKEFLLTQYADQLHVSLDELERLIQAGSDGQVKLERPLSDPRYSAHLSGAYWEIQKNSTVLARSPSLEGPMLKVPAGAGEDAQTHTYEIDGPTGKLMIAERLRWLGQDEAPTRIIVGNDRNALDREMQKFNYVLLWSLGGFAISLIAAAAVLLLYAMNPFGQLRKALARLRKGEAIAISGAFPDEVQPLIDDLNSLLANSGEQMVRARTQAGNMAHGLKSSLAILVDEAHRLRERGEAETATLILDHARRMQRQIDYQIARARAAASRAKPGQASSLSTATEVIVHAMERLYHERGIRIDNVVPSGTTVACDAEDLSEMLANIVDNACKHAKHIVRIAVEESGPRTFIGIVVEDDGPGLPPEAWDVVFNIGEQWRKTSGGSGLGLTIVRDLAQLYNGSVQLDQSDLGGLKVTLELPVHPETARAA
ncbi:MAG: HAMP domain-containing histidine kinase [Hyphomicrobium sp.]|nr:MAG: HAMP domain-containing histidine kinase [Hyphomicrobium sp.]MBZ0209756.1 HAMP domain-containing histidine kinase [Hyphomicrobium sp.]